jgi:hypothetical protein
VLFGVAAIEFLKSSNGGNFEGMPQKLSSDIFLTILAENGRKIKNLRNYLRPLHLTLAGSLLQRKSGSQTCRKLVKSLKKTFTYKYIEAGGGLRPL